METKFVHFTLGNRIAICESDPNENLIICSIDTFKNIRFEYCALTLPALRELTQYIIDNQLIS